MRSFPKITVLAFATLALTACEMRDDGTHTQVKAPTAAAPAAAIKPEAVQIVEGGTNRPHTVIGPLKVTVGKLTAFHPDPTRAMAQQRLREEAAKIGANGVINASISEVQIVPLSWGARIASGTAVRF